MTSLLVISVIANIALAYVALAYRGKCRNQKRILIQWNKYADHLESWIRALTRENDQIIAENENLVDYVDYLESIPANVY